MAKILKQNVVLRPDINSQPIAFLKGEELPDEYLHLVGDHLFEDMSPYEEVERRVALHAEPKPVKTPATPAPKPVAEETDEVPAGNASKATWKAYAEKHGVDVPADAGREDIKDLVKAKFPDLEV